MTFYENYNKNAPPSLQIRAGFFFSILGLSLLLMAIHVVFLFLGVPPEIRSVASNWALALSISGMCISCVLAGLGSYYESCHRISKKLNFKDEATVRYLAWAFERRTILGYMTAALIAVVMACGLITELSSYWALLAAFIVSSLLVAVIVGPMQFVDRALSWNAARPYSRVHAVSDRRFTGTL